ncbi:uncharacterized [Tachysurus ichikawai]
MHKNREASKEAVAQNSKPTRGKMQRKTEWETFYLSISEGEGKSDRVGENSPNEAYTVQEVQKRSRRQRGNTDLVSVMKAGLNKSWLLELPVCGLSWKYII